jgi:peptide deformylase
MSDEQTIGAEESERREFEAELLARREAALSNVVKFGDPVLKSKASPVGEFGPELRAEVERMIGIMRDALGVGLAATQLGVLRRLLVFQASGDVALDVERALHARVSGLDVDGKPVTIEASGLEARVLQHEIDHLDGVLILDRAPRKQRKEALRALREGVSYSPSVEDDQAGAGEGEEHREPRTEA